LKTNKQTFVFKWKKESHTGLMSCCHAFLQWSALLQLSKTRILRRTKAPK